MDILGHRQELESLNVWLVYGVFLVDKEPYGPKAILPRKAVSLPGGGCSDLGKGCQFHPPSRGCPHPDVNLEKHHVVRHGLSRGQPVVVDPRGAGGVGLTGL